MAEQELKRIRILHPFRSYQGGEEVEKRAEIADRYVAEGHAELVEDEHATRQRKGKGGANG
jgi:hypothetical protein